MDGIGWNPAGRRGGSSEERHNEEQMFNHILAEVESRGQSDAASYDMGSIMQDMKQDRKRLKTLIGRIDKMRPFDKKLDAVADRILADDALGEDGKKVLIFTEYTDTAKHVYKKLNEKFHQNTVRLLTGSVKSERRKEIIQMFAPIANNAKDAGINERIDILVSTEVLSEGQNLQDCNYIINYDLPWNPVRIVQRIGRLDRLTSKWDTLYSRQCFPEEQLNSQVDLKGIVLSKVNEIKGLGLLDTDLLGVEADPKQFAETKSRLEIIAGTDEVAADKIWRDLEAEADLFPKSSYLDILKKYANREFVNRMSHEPLGRRSGTFKHGEPPVAVLAYKDAKSDFHTVAYKYNENKAIVVESREAFKIISCTEGTATHLPMDKDVSSVSFRHMVYIDKLAKDAIVERSGQDRAEAEKTDKGDNSMRKHIKNAMKRSIISREDATFVDDLVKSGRLKPWYNELEEVMKDHNEDAIKKLINTLKQIFVTCDSGGHPIQHARIKHEDLTLIGTMFVTGNAFDAGLYWND